MPDSCFLRISYRGNTEEKLNLKNPQTFNEKLQWLKLYDRNPLYTKLADKYEVREFVSKVIGDKYPVPLLGVYNGVDEIDFDTLPERFVLKCTHDQGSVIICRDKKQLDMQKAKRFLNKRLAKNPFWATREWPYKNIIPRIICEEFLIDESGYELKDYKFFCFNGKVKCFKIDFDRFIGHRANYFDPKGKLLAFGEIACPPEFEKQLEIPQDLDKMINLAEILSNNYPFVRVDFYYIKGKIYFGEMTFYPASGFGKFEPESADWLLGSWLDLSKVTIRK